MVEKEVPRKPKVWHGWPFVVGLLILTSWVIFALLRMPFFTYMDDEGFYSIVSREVWRGRMLYHDVFFTQMPLMPYLYGAFLRLMPQKIECGRIISVAFLALGAFALAGLVYSRYSGIAALCGIIALCGDSELLVDGCRVLTVAPVFGVFCTTLLFLERADRAINGNSERKVFGNLIAGGLLLAATVLVRLSFLPFLIIVPIYFWWRLRTRKSEWGNAPIVALSVAAIVPTVVWSLYYAAIDWPRFLFSIYGWNAANGATMSYATTLPDFLTGALSSWPEAWIILGVAGALLMRGVGNPQTRVQVLEKYGFETFCIVMWIVLTAIHATRKPAYEIYQVPLAWAPVMAVSAMIERYCKNKFIYPAIAAITVLTCGSVVSVLGLSSVASADASIPKAVYSAAGVLRNAGRPTFISLDSGISYCAPNARLLPGYEMGIFSLMGDWIPSSEAVLGAVTPQKMLADMQTTDYFVIRRSDMRLFTRSVQTQIYQTMSQRYMVAEKVDGYGQFGSHGDVLLVMKRVR